MTSPFDTIHLQKMNVRLDECGDLSEAIAGMLEEYTIKEEIETAEKLFEETQQ